MNGPELLGVLALTVIAILAFVAIVRAVRDDDAYWRVDEATRLRLAEQAADDAQARP